MTTDNDIARIAEGLTEAERERAGRQLYEREVSNDPVIHCNRFPSWDELSVASKERYRALAHKGTDHDD